MIAVGSRVIVRSNEYHEQFVVGLLVRYETFGGKTTLPGIPVIKSEEDQKEYICGGAIIEYNEQVKERLSSLSPREQWNLLKEFTNRKAG